MQPIYWLLIAIVCIPVGLVMANRLRMDLAAVLIAAVLAILQLAGLGIFSPAHSPTEAIKAFSGFSQPVMITLLSLLWMVIASGLCEAIPRQEETASLRSAQGRLPKNGSQ